MIMSNLYTGCRLRTSWTITMCSYMRRYNCLITYGGNPPVTYDELMSLPAWLALGSIGGPQRP